MIWRAIGLSSLLIAVTSAISGLILSRGGPYPFAHDFIFSALVIASVRAPGVLFEIYVAGRRGSDDVWLTHGVSAFITLPICLITMLLNHPGLWLIFFGILIYFLLTSLGTGLFAIEVFLERRSS